MTQKLQLQYVEMTTISTFKSTKLYIQNDAMLAK